MCVLPPQASAGTTSPPPRGRRSNRCLWAGPPFMLWMKTVRQLFPLTSFIISLNQAVCVLNNSIFNMCVNSKHAHFSMYVWMVWNTWMIRYICENVKYANRAQLLFQCDTWISALNISLNFLDLICLPKDRIEEPLFSKELEDTHWRKNATWWRQCVYRCILSNTKQKNSRRVQCAVIRMLLETLYRI